jgi:hypothetical protein
MPVVDGVGTRGETGRVYRLRGGKGIQSTETAFVLPGDSPESLLPGLAADTPSMALASCQLDGVLGIQGRDAALGDDGSGDDRPARRQVSALLAELSALQRTLLGGGGSDTVVRRLTAILEIPPVSVPPHLLSVVLAARLRVMVELARRGLAQNQ